MGLRKALKKPCCSSLCCELRLESAVNLAEIRCIAEVRRRVYDRAGTSIMKKRPISAIVASADQADGISEAQAEKAAGKERQIWK